MKRIVFAWELGANLGHLERDLVVALRLRELGADVRFIVPNLSIAERILAPQGFAYLPAPMSRPAQRKPRTPINYSELIADCGFDDKDVLTASVRAWLELWKLLSPDMIVIDHAPTAVLAAEIAGIPNVPLGSGFCVPLCKDPMPAFHVAQRGREAALRAADQSILPTINHVARVFGHAEFATVAAVFGNPKAQVTSIPELDPFGPRPGISYVGPITAPGRHKKVEWFGRRPKRVFAYLQSGMVGLESILLALRQPEIEAIVVIPGVRDSVLKRYQSEEIRILTEPVDLEALLPTAHAVVGYASAGLVSTALMASVPLLLFPVYLEHQLTAARCAQLGVATVAKGLHDSPAVAAALSKLLGPSFASRAAGLIRQSMQRGSMATAISQVCQVLTS